MALTMKVFGPSPDSGPALANATSLKGKDSAQRREPELGASLSFQELSMPLHYIRWELFYKYCLFIE